MSIYTYQVKQDKQRTWKPLSVTTKHPMEEYEMMAYAYSWAISTQKNPDTVAIRCVNLSGDVVAIRQSNASVNKGKQS